MADSGYDFINHDGAISRSDSASGRADTALRGNDRRLHDLVLTSEPPQDTPPTPPYRQYPASEHSDSQLPPNYRSRSQIHLADESEKRDMDEKRRPSEDSTRDIPHHDEQAHHHTKGVHYTEEFPHREKPVRFESSSELPSRAPSVAPSDDEHDDDDEYDWSTDDDEVDQDAKKFEESVGGTKQRSLLTRVFTFFLSTLVGSALTSGLLVAAALLVHFLWYNKSNDDNRSHRQYVTQNVEAWLFWAAANLLISWVLAFIINIIPGIVIWAIFIVWGHISESMKSRVELYNSLKDTAKPIFYGASCWLSWNIIFENIFDLYNHGDEDQSRASYTPRVYQVIEFLFFLTLVLCLQRMLSQLIAFSFHRTAFKERLDTLEFSLKTVDHLKKYKPKHRSARSSGLFAGFAPLGRAAFFSRSSPNTPADEKAHFFSSKDTSRFNSPDMSRKGTPDPYDEGHMGDDEDNSYSSKKGKGKAKHSKEDTFIQSPVESRPDSPANALSGKLVTNANPDHSYPPPSPSPRPTPSRRNSSDSDNKNAVLQAGKALKKAALHDARNIAGKDDPDLGGLGFSVGSTDEARRLARSIFEAFRSDRRRRYLVVEDFYPAFKSHDEALEAFRVFDKDHNGDISKGEIKSTLVKTYRERRFLARSMRDVGAALRSLNHVLLFFAFVILFFISLSVFGVDFSSSLTSFYTIGIAASFIFKATATRMFDSIMFLFVTHPFDTGDRCFIDEENLVVKKMGLLATVFQRADGTETYYFNSQLFTKFITNARRSDKTGELCTLFIDWKTPLAKLDELERLINEWLSVDENRWYQPSSSIIIQRIENQCYMEISIVIPHNQNWQDWGLRLARKSTFYAAATYYCRQLGITYAHSPMPLIWSRNEEAQQQQNVPMSDTGSVQIDIDDGAAAGTKDMKPMMGFLPPPESRNPNLLRARKSKGGKKAAMRAMDG